MASGIDPSKPTAGNAYTSHVRANFSAAADEIESLQGAQFTGSGTGMVFSRAGTVRFPQVGDGVTNVATTLNDFFASLAGTRKTLELDDGDYLFGSVLSDVNGFWVSMSPQARLIATVKTGLRIKIKSNGRITGGQIYNRAARRYRISALSSTGSQVTCTLLQADLDDPELGAHGFLEGDSVRLQSAGCTSGSLNNTPLTVASVTATQVVLTCTATTSASTIPYEILDGSGRLYYPIIYLNRTSTANDALIFVQDANDFLISDVKLRWSAINGIQARTSSHGRIDRVEINDTAADACHLTGACHDIQINGLKVTGACDDSLALVGYVADAMPNYDITIRDFVAQNNFSARGLAFIGTKNCKAFNSNLNNIIGAGIFISQDGSYGTYGNEGYLIDGFTLRNCGSQISKWPNNWAVANYSAIHDGGGALPHLQNRDGAIRNGKVYNSRYRGMHSSTSPVVRRLLDNIEFNETDSAGMLDVLHDTSVVRNVSFRNVGGAGLSMNTAGDAGTTDFIDLKFTNINRGERRWLASASVSAGTLTLRAKAGVDTSAMTTGVSVVVAGVGSGYNSVAEAAKDYAINATWTIATRTVDAGGDYLTVTGTGLSDTAHATCFNPQQPCPNAYVALQAGAVSSTDGMFVGPNYTGKARIIRPQHTENVYLFERSWEFNATPEHQVWVEQPNMVAAGTGAISGVGAALGSGYWEDFGRISSDADTTLTRYLLRYPKLIRTGMTVGRTDTIQTASTLAEAMPALHRGLRRKLEITNMTNVTHTLAAADATITISGTVVTSPNLTSYWFAEMTNVGSPAFTFTRVE